MSWTLSGFAVDSKWYSNSHSTESKVGVKDHLFRPAVSGGHVIGRLCLGRTCREVDVGGRKFFADTVNLVIRAIQDLEINACTGQKLMTRKLPHWIL